MTRRIAFRTVVVVALVLSFTGAVAAAPPAPTPTHETTVDRPPPLAPDAVTAFPGVSAPDPVVRWMVDQVEQETVYQYDGDLSGENAVMIRGSSYTIKTRNTNSGTPIQQATNYVGDHLAALGLTVEYHRWGPATAPNVIGQKLGSASPGNIYMVTAHLDDMPSGGTAPGADDNASGSTAVLVAADILSQFDWNCTLRFALWTGEEQGLLGSEKYAKRSSDNKENIVGVLNLDMIAWNTPGSLPEIDLNADKTRPATVDLANQMASVIHAYDLDLVPEVLDYGETASDHASFWDYGYNAILGIEDYYPNDHDFDPYYHKATDKLSTLNLPYFTEFVKAAVAESAHMAGCLTTGTLQGAVTASHDGSLIAKAGVGLQDGAGRQYGLTAGDGHYSQPVPPATYAATASAYGYGESTASGIQLPANATAVNDFVLTALPPAATTATTALDLGEVRLTWPHVNPDTAYEVHRSTSPYFAPLPSTALTELDANHQPAPGETVSYRDDHSGAGDATTNHFYAIVGVNAAGVGVDSGRTGEFDFLLSAPAGS